MRCRLKAIDEMFVYTGKNKDELFAFLLKHLKSASEFNFDKEQDDKLTIKFTHGQNWTITKDTVIVLHANDGAERPDVFCYKQDIFNKLYDVLQEAKQAKEVSKADITAQKMFSLYKQFEEAGWTATSKALTSFEKQVGACTYKIAFDEDCKCVNVLMVHNDCVARIEPARLGIKTIMAIVSGCMAFNFLKEDKDN